MQRINLRKRGEAKRKYWDCIAPLLLKEKAGLLSDLKKASENSSTTFFSNIISEAKKACNDSAYLSALEKLIFASLEDMATLPAKTSKGRNIFKTEYKTINKINDEVRAEYFRDIMEILDVRICPYCNHAFIDYETAFQKDHFFAKSKYPLLTLSFFNLVPSCSYCNTKKSTNEIHDIKLNPYHMNFNDDAIRMKAVIDTEKTGSIKDLIDLRFSCSSDDYHEFYLKKLKLESIYKNDIGHVLDKIRAYSIYNEFYQKLLSENSVFCNQKGIQAFISELCDIALHSNTREGKPNKNILYKLDKDIEEEFEKEI